jgi:hypothetical protein
VGAASPDLHKRPRFALPHIPVADHPQVPKRLLISRHLTRPHAGHKTRLRPYFCPGSYNSIAVRPIADADPQNLGGRYNTVRWKAWLYRRRPSRLHIRVKAIRPLADADPQNLGVRYNTVCWKAWLYRRRPSRLHI